MFVDLAVVLDDGSVESFTSAQTALEFIEANDYHGSEIIGVDPFGEPWDVPLDSLRTLAEEEAYLLRDLAAQRKAIDALSSKDSGG